MVAALAALGVAVLVYGGLVLATLRAARPPRLLDLDGNGVPDWREPWFWERLWTAVSWLVRTCAAPDTLAHRAVVEAERWRQAARAPRE